MASSFFGLSIAASGLTAFQAAINTTSNNISNVQTEGYSRQEVNMVATTALRVYQRYGSVSTGVSAEAAKSVRDEYYDVKYWDNQSKYGFYNRKLYYMDQVEEYFTDDSTVSGFSTLFGEMFNALDELQDDAGDTSVRSQFISSAQSMMTYFNDVSTEMSNLQTTVNDEIKSTVNNINSIAQKIATLNKQINIIEMEGGYANELRDDRALLVDELSEIVPVTVTENEVTNSNFPDMKTGATYYTLKVNGINLVDQYEYKTLSCQAREEKHNQSDIDGLYDVIWNDSGATLNVTSNTMTGSLKALFEVRDGNDMENMTGTVTKATSNTITISNPSITQVEKLNSPASGVVTVNNKEMAYDSFDYETDADGNITAVTYNLSEPVSSDVWGGFAGKTLTVGSSIDFKGIPYYQNQMNEFLRVFCKSFNEIEQTGQDYNGDQMGSFFAAYDSAGYQELDMLETNLQADGVTAGVHNSLTGDNYYRLTAANCRVKKSIQNDPRLMATTVKSDVDSGVDACDLITQLQTLENDQEIYRGAKGSEFLQCIYADITVDTQEADVFTTTYTNIGETIEQQRMSVSSVDEDDEALDLVKFQNAYNLASKCISVLNEMYEQLILNTGV